MLTISLYWFIVCAAKCTGITYTAYFAIALLICSFIIFNKNLKRVCFKILKHKKIIFVVMIIFQFLILLSSKIMIRSDAAAVFLSATGQRSKEALSNYLSFNPNNLFLFFYEKFFYSIFGKNCIWVLQILNIIYLDLFIIITSIISNKYLDDKNSIFFYLALAIIGFSAQFVAMYTDIMILPIASILLLINLKIMNTQNIKQNVLWGILLGFVSGIGILIRATILVLEIAFYSICLLTKRYKQLVSIIPFIILTILLYTVINNIFMNSDSIYFVKNVGKNYLSFIDLGLTESGTDQIDFENSLAGFYDPLSGKNNNGCDNRYTKEVVLQDINRRLNNYNFRTFNRHLLYKSAYIFEDGTLGWAYTDNQIDYYMNPLYEKIKDNKYFTFIRNSFIYVNEKEYSNLKFFENIVMCIIVFGIIYSIKSELLLKNNNDIYYFLLLSIFGGILFLMIFEGGKARYLIQFLPQILLVSSIGLNNIIEKANK